jgi:hypothetical protein
MRKKFENGDYDRVGQIMRKVGYLYRIEVIRHKKEGKERGQLNRMERGKLKSTNASFYNK